MSAPPAAVVLSAVEADAVLRVAVDAVRAEVAADARRSGADPGPDAPSRLREPGASFVTLRSPSGALRGCIGTLEATRPLGADVAHNAVRAATADPRLPAVARAELGGLEVKVSVLSELAEVVVGSRDELCRTVRPGTDGLLVSAGRHRATFLPAVWEQVPDPERFLDMLWEKAGLAAGAWPSGIRIDRYLATEVGPVTAGPPP